MSRTATTEPDRSYTRVVFIDAVEPKKPIGRPRRQLAHPFPNTIDPVVHAEAGVHPPLLPDASGDREASHAQRS